jgi:hypothetical protein
MAFDSRLIVPVPLQCPAAAARVQLTLDLDTSLRLAAFSEVLQLEEEGVQDAWLLLQHRAGDGGVL